MNQIQLNVKTMSSIEIVKLINEHRFSKAYEEKKIAMLRHSDFLAKVPIVLGGEYSEKFRSTYLANNGKENPCYRFEKREACLMAMSYSYELQAIVFDRMTELEDNYKKNVVELPNFEDPAEAAIAWAAEYKAKQLAQEQLQLAAPKVAFVDKYVESEGNKTFREVAKLIGISEPSFRQFLKYHKIMYQLNGTWTAYAQHFDAKRFQTKAGVSERNGKAFTQCLFTPKGIEWIAGELAKSKVLESI